MQLSEKLTKEIFEKYPKVWKELDYKLFSLELDQEDTYCRLWIDTDKDKNPIIYYDGDNEKSYSTIPFSMFYGLLEDFFEKDGIPIEIYKNDFNNSWTYRVSKSKFVIMPHDTLKDEAKYCAILKACEIKENSDEKQ